MYLMRASDGQTQRHLDDVVHDQLRRDNRSHMGQSSLQADIEASQTVLLVDMSDNRQKATRTVGSGGGAVSVAAVASFVGRRQDHVARLRGNASDDGSQEGRHQGNAELDILAVEKLLRHAVQLPRDDVEGHLLAHRIRYLV